MRIGAEPPRQAREGLSDREQELWDQITESLPSDWFDSVTGELLRAYVRHCYQSELISELLAQTDLSADLDRWNKLAGMYDRETNTMLGLARTMRLTQQSRIQPRTAGRMAAKGNSFVRMQNLTGK
jgi:hypothetical protein